MNELDQLRNFIDRRINTLANEIIQHSLVLEFDECKTKHAVRDELHDIKAELNRLSWLNMESKLQITQKIEPIIIKELKS